MADGRADQRISIHALREEGDAERFGHQRNGHRISIHALREEGDPRILPRSQTVKYFYPRPPRGGRQSSTKTIPPPLQFLSTPSARRATRRTVMMDMGIEISIHALREEGDGLTHYANDELLVISIHALREEGDLTGDDISEVTFEFLSTPSARRATPGRRVCCPLDYISIHALREEGDSSSIFIMFLFMEFLSTPSARRATAKTETKSLFSNKLYNILHEFRRALIYNGSKSYPNHAK